METKLMIDSSAAESRPTPRRTVAYETGSSTWSAFYGAIPLGQSFVSVSDAWDAIDRMAASRLALVPVAADIRPADADEPAEASHDGGDPNHRRGRSPHRTRSSEARERRAQQRGRGRRAPMPAAR